MFQILVLHNNLSLSNSEKELKAGVVIQELMQNPWKSTAYCLSCPNLLSLFSYSTQDHKSKGGTTHSELGMPTSIINEENALRSIFWGYILC